ncbi:MAG: bifunctional diaminohydroxyphosphoribosylaminopyrimidine deaminase/5-amino-6-(5-phosphoribosylamino)uracil reductase RibD [Prevotella sp.]|nr:bifunctional diaminohydroxyphosphoribosylaminopyrimidine deaminase/5-amino-6-(5-phosphoribosylamino)uracil reductase RibD [Candidatus Prevotella equi]
MITDDDILLMEEAMILAQQGEGNVNPNPLVGAVIVKDDEVIASGYHTRYGDLHAEREAFKNADERGIDCAGATMYVTLEPCCHQGHQPPCTEAIIEHKISRVVVGLLDPNPLVAGKGMALLREAGIEVEPIYDEATPSQYVMPSVERAAKKMVEKLQMQNRVFLKFITTGMPWVTAKWAMTLDGKIATYTGDSKWITSEKSRERVHMIRRNNMGILCGIGTVLADDPMLNVRLSEDCLDRLDVEEFEVRHPVRIVADRQARIPMESQLVSTAREIPTVVAYADGADEEKLQMLRDAGVVLWNCNSLKELLQRAGAEKLDSVLLESGGTLSEALLREGLVDEVLAFVAPKIIGGRQAKTPVEGEGFTMMSEAIELKDTVVETIGSDVLISGMIEKCSQE